MNYIHIHLLINKQEKKVLCYNTIHLINVQYYIIFISFIFNQLPSDLKSKIKIHEKSLSLLDGLLQKRNQQQV